MSIQVEFPGHRNKALLPSSCSYFLHRRSPGRVEVHHESHGSSAADRPLALLRHRHVRHHRGWVLHWQIPHHLLQDRHWWERQLGCGASLLQPAVFSAQATYDGEAARVALHVLMQACKKMINKLCMSGGLIGNYMHSTWEGSRPVVGNHPWQPQNYTLNQIHDVFTGVRIWLMVSV